MATSVMSKEDAHDRVCILFSMPSNGKLFGVSVKWLLTHGVPIDPETGRQMVYDSTHIIQ